jgi:hypothetical protein
VSEDLFGNEVEDKNNDRRGNKPKMKKEGAEKSGLVGMPSGELRVPSKFGLQERIYRGGRLRFDARPRSGGPRLTAPLHLMGPRQAAGW